jgi:5'(3')-deoxyribonucleotidase
MDYTVKFIYKEGQEPQVSKAFGDCEEIADFNEALARAKFVWRHSNDVISEITISRPADGFVYYSTAHDKELRRYEEMSIDQWHMLERYGNVTAAYQSVYIDIDGTAAYWYKDGKGLSYPEQILDPKYHYYRDLEPHEYIIDLARELQNKGVDVCILSATDREVFADRWEWIEENMPFIPKENICMCPIGADKSNFCKNNAEISILIDDYEKNLDEWKGKTFKSVNNVNSLSEKHSNINTAKLENLLWKGESWEYEKALKEDTERILTALKEIEKEHFKSHKDYIKE